MPGSMVLSLAKKVKMSPGYSPKGRVNDARSLFGISFFKDGKKNEMNTLKLLIMAQLLKEHLEMRRIIVKISVCDLGWGLSHRQDVFQLSYILEDNDTMRGGIFRLLDATDEILQYL